MYTTIIIINNIIKKIFYYLNVLEKEYKNCYILEKNYKFNSFKYCENIDDSNLYIYLYIFLRLYL